VQRECSLVRVPRRCCWGDRVRVRSRLGAQCARLVPARTVGSVAVPWWRPVTASVWLVMGIVNVFCIIAVTYIIATAPRDKDTDR